MHFHRTTFAAGFAVGYVLGARAGRARYEQIVRLARAAAEHPAVQQAAGTLQAQAVGLVASAGDKIGSQVQERMPKLADAASKVGQRMPGGRHKEQYGSAGANGGAPAGHSAPMRP